MNKLIRGDCLEKLKEIENGLIDMILTDPPYEISNSGGGMLSRDNRELNEVHHWPSDVRVKTYALIEPYVQRDLKFKKNGRSYSPPRYATKTIKRVEISTRRFDENNIEPFEGKTLKDLADNVKKYLSDLVEELNTPLHVCKHCEGSGHVLKKQK
jgi:hypothetical protein